MGRLLTVNLAVVRDGAWTGAMGRSGIDKRPVSGPVRAGPEGLGGDTVVDRRFHGGVDRAGYAFAHEDYAWWMETLGRRIIPGNFGENLTTAELDVTGARIGELWAIGSAVFEVSAPRVPCRVFAGFWDVPDLIARFTQRAEPGAYLRVRTPGEVTAGDAITIVHRPNHDITIGSVFRALTTEPERLPELGAVADVLPTDIRRRVRRRLAHRVPTP
ncbi:MOSC domain-containing protein [Frankia sp. AiPa1]|uniref:MOSC domain-containing protein n=1 Tax=Frankia sp. AiPa1 TaxID=573492 RepID=UPI00202BA158|nr:MOSC domain-containing protein [Frankia sp. AiPa1]MCL9760493.1 MOSC domain-containing protein [Frankia sp. AiPa1]